MTNATWKCLRCDGVKAKTTRENEPFSDILPGVVLPNVEVTRCEACGNREVEIPCMDNLMKAVARAVAKATNPISSTMIQWNGTSWKVLR